MKKSILNYLIIILLSGINYTANAQCCYVKTENSSGGTNEQTNSLQLNSRVQVDNSTGIELDQILKKFQTAVDAKIKSDTQKALELDAQTNAITAQISENNSKIEREINAAIHTITNSQLEITNSDHSKIDQQILAESEQSIVNIQEEMKRSTQEMDLLKNQNRYETEEKRAQLKLKLQSGILSSQFQIASAEIDDALKKLQESYERYSQDKPLYVEQIRDVAYSVLNENGLVKEYLKFNPTISNYQFKTTFNNTASLKTVKDIRRIINKALHIQNFSYSPEAIEKSEIVIDLALKIDTLLSEKKNKLANRYNVRAQTLLNFLTDTGTKFYKQAKLSNDSKNYFDFNIQADNYENYSIIDVANNLSKQLKKTFTNENLLYAELSLKEAEFSAKNGNIQKFENDLDRGWAFVDFLAGVATGAANATGNLVFGIGDILTHPADMALAVGKLFINAPEVAAYLVKDFLNTKQYYNSLSDSEKGQFYGAIAFEIVTAYSAPAKVTKFANLESDLIRATKKALEVEYPYIVDRLKVYNVPKSEIINLQVNKYLGTDTAVVINNWGTETFQKVNGLLRQYPELMPILDKWGNGSLEKTGAANQMLQHIFAKKYESQKRLPLMEKQFNLPPNSLNNIYKTDDPIAFKQAFLNFDQFTSNIKNKAVAFKLHETDPKVHYSFIKTNYFDGTKHVDRYYVTIEYDNKLSSIYPAGSYEKAIKIWENLGKVKN